MSTAHQEAIGMACVTLFYVLVLVLAVRYKKRTGKDSGWVVPSMILIVLCLGLTVFTASGHAVSGW